MLSTTLSTSASPTRCISIRHNGFGSGTDPPYTKPPPWRGFCVGRDRLEHLPVRCTVGLVVDALRVLDHNWIATAEVVVEPLRIVRADVDAAMAHVPLALI